MVIFAYERVIIAFSLSGYRPWHMRRELLTEEPYIPAYIPTKSTCEGLISGFIFIGFM